MTAEQSIRNIERLMDAVNAAARGTLTVKPDPRADLVDLFEAHAETHDDKSWIEVEEAVDLVMDRGAEITDEQVQAAARAFTLAEKNETGDPITSVRLDYIRAALEAAKVAHS